MKIIFTSAIFFCFAFNISAQRSGPPVKKSSSTGGAVIATPKSASEDKLSADEMYKYGNFDLALPLYLEDLKIKPNDPYLLFRIGSCFLETNFDKKQAIKYLELALPTYKGDDMSFQPGRAYMYAERFDEALKRLQMFKNLVATNDVKTKEADRYIKYCNNAKAFTAKPLNVRFENLGDAINSNKCENMAFIDPNETFMIYNSNRIYISEFDEYIWNIYTCNYKLNKWKKAKSIGSKINQNDNFYIGGASPNLENLVIRPDTYDHSGDLLISNSNGKNYDVPDLINDKVNTKNFESSGCVSTSGDTLYFASDRPGGHGGFDIYFSLRIGGEWGVPQNMGPSINTPDNEEFPNISFDGKTLYFSCDGRNSMGGYDLFSSKYNVALQNWSQPENLGYPINSTYDDYSISFSSSPRYAYVAAVREGGYGDYDIYKVVFNNIAPPLVTYTGKILVGDSLSATPIVQLSQKVSIQVFDKKTNQLYGEYSLNKSGKFVVTFPPGNFIFKIDAEGYNKYEKLLEVPDKQPDSPEVFNDIYLGGKEGEAPAAPAAPAAKKGSSKTPGKAPVTKKK